MKIKVDTLRSRYDDLIELIENAHSKAKQHSLTKQEFLQFIREAKEKNNLLIEEVDKVIELYKSFSQTPK